MIHVYHNMLHIFKHQDHKTIQWLFFFLKNLDNLLRYILVYRTMHIYKVQINFNAHPFLIH